MNNKVLIKLIVPELDATYDLFIPVNERIWKILKLILKAVYSLSGGMLDLEREYLLINKNINKVYANNDIIIETEIRNATEIILLSNTKNNYNPGIRMNIIPK